MIWSRTLYLRKHKNTQKLNKAILKPIKVKHNNFFEPVHDFNEDKIKKEIKIIQKLVSLRRRKDELLFEESPTISRVGSGFRRHRQLEPLIKIF